MKKVLIFTFSGIILLAFISKLVSPSSDSADDLDEIAPFVSSEKSWNEDEVNAVSASAVEDDKVDDTPTLQVNETLTDEDLYRIELPRMTVKRPEQMLKRVGYITSYNNQTKNANWVAWKLTREHVDGPFSRKGVPYYEDMEVEGGRQELSDWYNTGLPIDHGHLCPAGDNKWSRDAMHQSFLLTNMCPQNSTLNQNNWEYLERRCRGWAKHYGEVYIATGPIFYSDDYATMGANKVGVPDAFFKVVLRLGKKPQAMGFIYKNDGEGHPLDYYLLSVDEVEKVTGMDFFYNLPDDIEDVVESSSDLRKW